MCNKNDILYERVGTSIYAYIILYTAVIVLCTNQRGATWLQAGSAIHEKE